MFDWNQARAFVTTAEAGSLSAAARQLGLTQPTLSRQVSALEEQLGVMLFDRVGKALILTENGLDLLAHAKRMNEAAAGFELAASGRSEVLEGTVSISASDGMAVHILTPLLRQLRAQAPQITIEIVVSNALSDLRRREADIAIRHVRPEEPELIARHVRDAEARFYASEDWVCRHGNPTSSDDARGRDFIDVDDAGRYQAYLKDMGLPVDQFRFPLVCDNSLVTWEMIRQGLGIGVMMTEIADQMSGIVQVLDDVEPVQFPFWVVTHRELQTSRRIRIVFDYLCAQLKRRSWPKL